MDAAKTINFLTKPENSHWLNLINNPVMRANEEINWVEAFALSGWGKMKGKNNSCTKHTGCSSTNNLLMVFYSIFFESQNNNCKVRFSLKRLIMKNKNEKNLNFPMQNATFTSKFHGLNSLLYMSGDHEFMKLFPICVFL